MGITASIMIGSDAAPVSREAWGAFCAEHGFVHFPNGLGGNVYQAGAIRAVYGASGGYVYRQRSRPGDHPFPDGNVREILFSTYLDSPAVGDIARLAQAARDAFGGSIKASPVVEALLVPRAA
jgi:hypothetical protein